VEAEPSSFLPLSLLAPSVVLVLFSAAEALDEYDRPPVNVALGAVVTGIDRHADKFVPKARFAEWIVGLDDDGNWRGA
jgi:hypothetical protein